MTPGEKNINQLQNRNIFFSPSVFKALVPTFEASQRVFCKLLHPVPNSLFTYFSGTDYVPVKYWGCKSDLIDVKPCPCGAQMQEVRHPSGVSATQEEK